MTNNQIKYPCQVDSCGKESVIRTYNIDRCQDHFDSYMRIHWNWQPEKEIKVTYSAWYL